MNAAGPGLNRTRRRRTLFSRDPRTPPLFRDARPPTKTNLVDVSRPRVGARREADRVRQVAGIRTSLTLADLDLTAGNEALTVRKSKTPAGRRTIPIVPQLEPLLHQWLRQLDQQHLNSPATPLLSSRHATPMPISFAWRLVKRVAHRAGVCPRPCTCATARPPHTANCPRNLNGYNRSDVTPHTLRRTFGSDLLNRGLRLEVVSKLLGHATTTITEHTYAELLDDTTRRELLHILKQPPTNIGTTKTT
jgi:integrase